MESDYRTVFILFPFGRADRDVRFVARADVPALRGVLRPRGLPPGHPLGGQVRAGVGILVGLLRRPADTAVSPPLFLWCSSLICSQPWRCRGFARFVNVRDDAGATPLHLAARQGWRRCVHVLLENGAIVSASSGAFGSGFRIPPPPFMSNGAFLCAKKKKNSRLLRKLCHVFDLSARFCRFPGSTPLHLAARGGNLDCVRQLLSWGADRLQRDSVG